MIVKTLTSLMLFISLNPLTFGQEGECGGTLSKTAFDNMDGALAYHSRCSYPTYKMNVSCILSSCPQLGAVCPLINTGSVNQTRLNTAVSILNTCLGQNGLICGINMHHTPLVQVTWTTDELIPLNMANGTVSLNPGTGYVSNLSKAKITVNQPVDLNGNITLTIDATDIIGESYATCNFSISNTSFINFLLPFPINFLNFPNMHGNYHFNLTSTVNVDLATQPPTFNTHVDQFNLVSAFTNFINQEGSALPEIADTLFNTNVNIFLKTSTIPSTAATFLSTYAVLSLQAVQQNCPS